MPFVSGKVYPHSLGLSCSFRQWRAASHCNKLHGYALQVEIQFVADELDERNWVQDFGALKDIKEEIQLMFDHKTVVAVDDPEMATFKIMEERGMADLVIVPAVGCEMFAKNIAVMVKSWMIRTAPDDRVRLASVKVSEHEGNFAMHVEPDRDWHDLIKHLERAGLNLPEHLFRGMR